MPWVRASTAALHCDPRARHIYPSLVLVQPRKTHPCLTERLLMGRKESNQTNKTNTISSIISECASSLLFTHQNLLMTNLQFLIMAQNIVTIRQEKNRYKTPIITLYCSYSQTCVKWPLSKGPKMFFKTEYRLMQVKSIAECSKGSILQYFRPSLSFQLSLRSLFCLFLSGRFTQILL